MKQPHTHLCNMLATLLEQSEQRAGEQLSKHHIFKRIIWQKLGINIASYSQENHNKIMLMKPIRNFPSWAANKPNPPKSQNILVIITRMIPRSLAEMSEDKHIEIQ